MRSAPAPSDETPSGQARGSPPAPRGVFIGGSAGGIEVLVELISRLPADLPAPVLVVLHVGGTGTSLLPTILGRAGGLRAVAAQDGDRLVDGTVYVAPRGRHMVTEERGVRLNAGPTEHGVRPAVDPLFRSAARNYGAGAVGVIVSGMLDDGAAGLREIAAHGGTTLVQEPRDAAFSSMPEAAIASVDVDYVLPAAELAGRIEALVRAPVAPKPRAPGDDGAAAAPGADAGCPTGMRTDLTCPLCGGVLWEEISDRLTTYRCGSGHVYSPQSLLAVQGDGLDSAIWRPIRILTERGALLQRLSERASQQGRDHSARRFADQASAALRRADELRRAVNSTVQAPDDETDEPSGEIE